MKFYYGVDPSQKRETLIKSKMAKPFIDEIIASADKAMFEDTYALKMSEYILFYKTGNRSVFEKNYFGRRRRCSDIMLAYWLTQNEKYLEPLIDSIMYICDEFTWCVPAHNDVFGCDSQEIIERVDLFQAETARLFAEIVMCVGDKLPEFLISRMKYEIRRRIFPSLAKYQEDSAITQDYKNGGKYWWETCRMNWAAVCGAGCVMAALYFGTDAEAERYVKRFIGCLDNYLEGIADDGCCQEGMVYWGYGFGQFVILAQAVKVYTEGKIDYFKNSKVRELALFPQKVRMSKSKVASISDGGEAFSFQIGLMSFLKSLYDDVIRPELEYGARQGNVDSACELLWFDENYCSDKLICETNYLSDAQWYISRQPEFSFVAKGGHNDEPHNHNDVGSFMITVGDEIFISDLGCGEYVKETFEPEKRYSFIQNSSGGHSVPIVNGEYQQAGSQFCSKKAKATGDCFELDIAGAYTSGIVNGIRRCFRIYENKVTLNDVFDFNSGTVPVIERFVSKIPPLLCNGYIDFGIARIAYDADRYTPSVGTDTFVAHNGIDVVTVYLIDFISVMEDENVFEFEFLL